MLSLLDLVRRQYKPGDYVIGQDQAGEPTYLPARPGAQSLPGLVVFRYDAELFYANANRFADHLESVISAAPDPVRWVALDCGAIDDIDYSAGVTLANLVNYSRAHNARFVLVRPDTQLLATLRTYGTLDAIGEDNIYPTLADSLPAPTEPTRDQRLSALERRRSPLGGRHVGCRLAGPGRLAGLSEPLAYVGPPDGEREQDDDVQRDHQQRPDGVGTEPGDLRHRVQADHDDGRDPGPRLRHEQAGADGHQDQPGDHAVPIPSRSRPR